MLVLPEGTRICEDTVSGEIKKCRDELHIDTVIIPTRGKGECGYENVEEVAFRITDRVIRVNEAAEYVQLKNEAEAV